MKLHGECLLVVYTHDAIRTEHEQIVVVLNSHLSDLRLRNDEILEINVSDGPGDRQFAIDPLDTVFRRYPATLLDDSLAFILPLGCLIDCDFSHATIILH